MNSAGGYQEQVDPARSDGDITSSTLTHRRYVTVTVRHAALATPTGEYQWHTVVRLRTSRMTRVAIVSVDSATPQGSLEFLRGNYEYERASCRGTSFAIDYAAGTVTVRVPRRCLGYPRWVRMGALTSTMDKQPSEADESVTDFADDAHANGTTVPFGPRLGRRVYRCA